MKIEKDTLGLILVGFFLTVAVIYKPSDRGREMAARFPPVPLLIQDSSMVQEKQIHVNEKPVKPAAAIAPAPKVKAPYKPLVYPMPDAETRRLIENYVQRFEKVAVLEMDKYDIPASIQLAQGILESTYGTSSLAVKNRNHFGIKCQSRRCHKGHCSNYDDDSHKDFFRIYPTAWESWRAHSQLLDGGRYAKLKKNGKDFRKWATGLKAAGYATDPRYAQKVIDIILLFNLQRFDDL